MRTNRFEPGIGGALAGLGVALAVFLGGCGPTTSVKEAVLAPEGSKWQRAWVEVVRDPGGSRASEFGVVNSPATETRSLHIAGAGREALIQLGKTAGKSETVETLRFAPDGHALAISTDGGRTWRYICLEAGEVPFLCDHVTVEAGSEGPWARAPRTRDLILEILLTATGGAPPAGGVSHFERSPFPRMSTEFGPAAMYVLAHAEEDEALRLAFVRAFFGPEAIDPAYGGVASGLAAFVPDAGKLVRSHEDVRAIFVAGLDGLAAANAAVVLSEAPDSRTADALATAVRTACAAGERTEARRQRALWLVWALARVAVSLEGGSEAAVAGFESVLGADAPFVEKEPRPRGLQSTAFARADDSAARRFAVKGLAALARSSPAARTALERLAAGPRRRMKSWTGEVVEEQATVSGFSLQILDLVGQERCRDQDEYCEVACWASAALQWLDHGQPR